MNEHDNIRNGEWVFVSAEAVCGAPRGVDGIIGQAGGRDAAGHMIIQGAVSLPEGRPMGTRFATASGVHRLNRVMDPLTGITATIMRDEKGVPVARFNPPEPDAGVIAIVKRLGDAIRTGMLVARRETRLYVEWTDAVEEVMKSEGSTNAL